MCAPHVVLTIMENLVLEHHVPRHAATQIEDAILVHLDRDGGWRHDENAVRQ
jgi:hypothetical protein